MGQALRLARAGTKCLGAALGEQGAVRVVLSLFFKATLGIERIFHFETLSDPGLAILTGGTSVLSRKSLGGLLRAAPFEGVKHLMRETRSPLKKATAVTISLDEHTLARFTRKFDIPKGFHTIRNKKMKAEKLFFAFTVAGRRLLAMIATQGDRKLAEVAGKLLPTLRRRARGAVLTIILDAGAADNSKAIIDLARHRRQVTIVRTPRRPTYRKAWEAIPESRWTELEEAGPYKGAPAKVIHLTETRTILKYTKADGSWRSQSVRTIVVREEGRKGKDRWHALWVFRDETTPAQDLLGEYRKRQNHEQRYRTMVHDVFVDTAPSGYDKESPVPGQPRFRENALTLYGWMDAVVTNELDELTEKLPAKFHHAHPRTLRRWLFEVPGEIYSGAGTLIVILKPRVLLTVWPGLVDRINRRSLHVPWLENRRLILSLDQLPGSGASDQEVSCDPQRGC